MSRRRPSRWSVAGSAWSRWAAVLTLACAACPGSTARGPDATPQARGAEPAEVGEWIYDAGFKDGWQGMGSASRDVSTSGVAKVGFGASGEWILSRPGPHGPYGALLFRVKEPPGEGEFLQIRLGASDGHAFPSVKLKPDHASDLGDGWRQIVVPMTELNPDAALFDRVEIRPFRPFGNELVLFDRIALAKATFTVAPAHSAAAASSAPQGSRARVRVACDAKATRISPLIYGIAFGDKGWERLGATARRWGGNPTSRYNWETHFSNAAQDWFFENRSGGPYADFLAESAAHGVQSALTIPMIGWVAKDGSSYSFPVATFGPQARTDQWRPDAGNGVSASGTNLKPGPPTLTSVPAPPEWAKRWVTAIRANDARTGKRSVHEYILDNEPMLWSSTHRDVHPDPVGYDELLDRTVQYATAIRQADPEATLAGPAEWGWSGYFYSAKDLASPGSHSDRHAHGDTPLVEWYLRKLHDHEQKTGVRLLDVLDLHYYPQAQDVYGGGAGRSDRATQLLRLRSTRALWDPAYVDESWIKEAVRLLPRMREWVDANYPGRGMSIGEWNFGGEKDVTGALATAEALGRFAQFGLTSAFYWTAPPADSLSRFAFLAYRNFDGKGGHFLDWYVPTSSTDGASFFASREADGKHLVVVAINMAPESQVLAELDLSACTGAGARPVESQQGYSYAGGAAGFAPTNAVAGAPSEWTLAPWSITVIDIRLQAR